MAKVFGAPEEVGLEESLIRVIELSHEQQAAQEEIIQRALGSASVRAAAEQRINDILIVRQRAFNTLNQLRDQSVIKQLKDQKTITKGQVAASKITTKINE